MTSHTDTAGRLVTGLLLVGLGGLFLAHNLDVLDARPYLRYWPAGLIAIGVASLVQACGASGRIAGVIWIAVGSWLLLEDFDLVHMSPWDLWPLLLVLGGVEQKTRLTAGERSPRLVVRGLVIMGGVEIKN